ncbi:MAG: hypothetical protein JWM82_4085 [Myxococcales bacterium]|nr:hypothetical protein [Myxococcales bacterium]
MALAVVCCACAAGCGGEGGTAAGGGSGFRAKVDGTPWVAESISIAAGPIKALPGSLLVVGSQNAAGKVTGLNLTLDNVTGPGPYALGVGSEVYGGIASIGETPTGTQASNVWETPLDGVSGQIVITTLTSDHLVATFAFVAAAGKKNLLGGMRTITDGQIDLPFSGALTPVPENVGSKVSATLNDVPYNAWLVSGMLKDFTGAAGVSISTASSVNALSLMLEGVTAPGVYALSDATPLRTIIIGKTGGDAAHCCWGLNGGGDVGTLTITSLTPARVKGTFTGTLQPQPGKPATTPLVVTDGAFDVGIP